MRHRLPARRSAPGRQEVRPPGARARRQPEGGIANFFEPDWVAPRYAAARPDIHSDLVAHVRRVLGADPLDRPALDVGCGTGLSTRPLRALARTVIGIDPSPAMVAEAVRAGGASYALARAEALPLADRSLDLVTIGCAYHWCDVDAFLGEALRVLWRDGHLVIYDSHFGADRLRPSVLLEWLVEEHWSRLPRTPRSPLPEVGSFDDPRFRLVGSHLLESRVRMSRKQLLLYLTTQSGAVAAVESGTSSLAEIEARLRSGLSRLVPPDGQEIHFTNPVWIVQPTSGQA